MDDSIPPLPDVFNQHGQRLDPYTGNTLEEGQEGPDSIFYVPSSSPPDPDLRLFVTEDGSVPFSEAMEKMRDAGFEGLTVTVLNIPRPEDRDRVPSPPRPHFVYTNESGVEMALGNSYCDECNYCWAIVQGKERVGGFTLREINQAANNGCSTCGVLHAGITRFADLIFPKYECGRVRVKQSENCRRPRPLLETPAVTVCFDEYGGETIVLSFSDQGKFETAFCKVTKIT
jgi:hypothetical protein